MTQQQILIVEDEPKLAQLIGDYLKNAGYGTHWIDNGLEVEDWVREHRPDLVLLDLMLPGKDGLDVCRDLRGFTQVPVIMVTARIEEIDRLLGLELGADDYICKPFSPRELVARAKAVLRRIGPIEKTPAPKGLKLDPLRFIVSFGEASVELTSVEFHLLKTLHSEPGRIFSRSHLMDRIYDDHRVVSDRTIDSHIKKLRRKLSSLSGDQELIQSVYGVGYKYEPGD